MFYEIPRWKDWEWNSGSPHSGAIIIGLAVSTEQIVLELIEQLVTTQNASKLQKRSYLVQANTKLKIVRIKIMLYIELELDNQTRLF